MFKEHNILLILFSKSLLCSPLRKHKRIKVILIWLHFKALIKLLKLCALISLPPFLIVYLYYVIKVQNPEKISQTRIYELLWIINDE